MNLIKLIRPYLLWGLFFASYAFFIYSLPEPSHDEPIILQQKVRVVDMYSLKSVEWDREKAVEFELNQIANTFYYLFVAAIGLLAFIAKILIDPIIESKRIEQFTPSRKSLLRHSGLLCLVSIGFGFYSRLYFNNIGELEKFTIYDVFGILALYQLVAFVLAALIFLWVVWVISKEKIC